MKSVEGNQELFELFDAVCSDTISPEGIERLESLLADSPAARRMYDEYLQLNFELYFLARVQRANRATIERKPIIGRFANFFPRPTSTSFTVAALVVAVILAVMAAVAVPIVRHVALSPAFATNLKTVAQITAMNNARWSDQDAGRKINTFLLDGQQIELLSGLVELTFQSGARVVVAGPAKFQPSGENGLELNTGELSANVPPVARGFAVATSAATFIDLGTEFTVGIDGAQKATLFVTRGSVAYQAVANPQRFVVGAGEGVEVSRDGIARRLPVEPSTVGRLPNSLARENLIVNGGFEAQFTQDVSAGWRSVGSQPIFWASSNVKRNELALRGEHYCRFGGQPQPGAAIEQVFTTTPGTQYVLTYYLCSVGLKQDKPELDIVVHDGDVRTQQELLHVTTKIDWQLSQWRAFQHRFVAKSAQTKLQFSEPMSSPSNRAAPSIDAVSVVIAADWDATLGTSAD